MRSKKPTPKKKPVKKDMAIVISVGAIPLKKKPRKKAKKWYVCYSTSINTSRAA